MKLRIAVVVAGSLIVMAAVLLGWLYLSARYVPAFYREALQAHRNDLQHHSDELLENAAALASNVGREGQWHARFTSAQINGWLAVDARKDLPELLPGGIADPRIAIHPDSVKLACRCVDGPVESVLSLDAQPYMQEPNVLSLRIHKARAGALPLPLGQVLQAISQAATEANLQITWRQADGDPVAVIRLPPPRDSQDHVYELETIELREGEIYVAGHTRRASASGSEANPEPLASKADNAKQR